MVKIFKFSLFPLIGGIGGLIYYKTIGCRAG